MAASTARRFAFALFLFATAPVSPAQIAEIAPTPRTSHVQTMAFYQGVHQNEDLPAAFMARHYDWTQQSIFGGRSADAFVRAGGKHAVVYTDPFVIFRCPSDAPRTCDDAEAFKNALSGAALFHDRSGRIVYSAERKMQRPNYASPEFESGFSRELKELIRQSNGAWGTRRGGYVELDDIGNKNAIETWAGVWPAPVEIATTAQVLQSKRSLIRSVAQITGVVLNGVNYDWPDNYDALFEVAGADAGAYYNENCFATDYGSGRLTADFPVADAWARQQNAIIAVISRGKFDICWGKGAAEPEQRMYLLSSFWLTYDPQWSVLWEEMCAAQKTSAGNCDSTWDDADIVPVNPAQTVRTTSAGIGMLQRADGLYVRTFADCYDAGRPIGPCAAAVNPSPRQTVPLPDFGFRPHSLLLSSTSMYRGGRHAWSPDAPRELKPRSGIIVAAAPSGAP